MFPTYITEESCSGQPSRPSTRHRRPLLRYDVPVYNPSSCLRVQEHNSIQRRVVDTALVAFISNQGLYFSQDDVNRLRDIDEDLVEALWNEIKDLTQNYLSRYDYFTRFESSGSLIPEQTLTRILIDSLQRSATKSRKEIR